MAAEDVVTSGCDQRELEELPRGIEKLEAERDALTKQLEDPALYQKSNDILRTVRDQILVLEQTLAQRYKRWEELENLRLSFEAE